MFAYDLCEQFKVLYSATPAAAYEFCSSDSVQPFTFIMFNDKFDELAGNNGEEYLRHFGFTVEDLSFLISPQSSLSPIKKKQRNVFNFDGYQEDGDVSPPTTAREPPAPGTYPGNYPTVYQPSDLFIKEESEEQMPLPSFDGLDLSCFDENQGKDPPPGPSTYSSAATAGSGASTIATEQVQNAEDPRAAFARMGSSMNMGSLAFSTMSSFNFDEAEADEYLKGEAALNKLNASANSNDAVGIGMYPHPENGQNNDLPPLPSLMQMTGGVHPSMICIEDASFIINAQQQHLNQQQHLLEQQHRAMNEGQWSHHHQQQSGERNGSQPLSRIGSFKSNLPPLSVDLNALNAAHHAHHQAKLHHGSSSGGGGGSSNNTSAHSMMGFPNSTVSSNSGTSSPERQSLTEPYERGSATQGTKKTERRGSESSMGGTGPGGKDDASRASKSLATISRRFVEHFGDANTFDYISGRLHVDDVYDGAAVTNRVDGAAEVLGVHVRRIYELIKILEILSLVTFTGDKRGKFSWRGTKDFLMTLGAIQADGIIKYPEVAYSHGVRVASDLPSPSLSSVQLYATSPLTSAGNTPIHSQSSPYTYFDGMGGGGGAGTANGIVEAIDGIADRGSTSNDAYDRNSLSGNFISNANENDIMNIDSLDFAQSPTVRARGVYGEEITVKSGDLDGGEMDVFVQQIAMLDSPQVDDSGNGGSAPRQSKKRAALKKSSKGGAPSIITPASTESHEEFMVEGICKSFLQLFLVGMDGLTMNYAIQRLVPMEANQTLSEYNKANATKIRRVYDVANVLCSLSLVNKVVSQKSKAAAAGGKSFSELGTPDSSSSQRDSSTPRKDLCRSSLVETPGSAGAGSGTGTGVTGTGVTGTGKGAGGGGRESSSKADAKVLEWGSFAPSVIRDFYLNRLHSQS